MPAPSPIDQNNLELSDAPSLIWIKVSEAYNLLWERNPKLHKIGDLVTSIEKYGFQEAPKYDSTLNAIKSGNGRVEALFQMERGGHDLPRGLGRLKDTGEWVMPVMVGTDAESAALARQFAIDANNLMLSGGDFTALDMARLWDQKEYLSVLSELAEMEAGLPVSVDGDDLDALVRMLGPNQEINYDEMWRGMPEFEQKDLQPVKSIVVHFAEMNDIEKFSELIGQPITEKTKFIWYPEMERENLKALVYHEQP
jgi:hypothetical protein